MKLRRVTVYAGSYLGNSLSYLEITKKLGQELAKRKIITTYGAGSQGMMGELFEAVVENNGFICGVITRRLVAVEKPPQKLKNLHIVETMAERKEELAKNAQAFVVLPGGLGTLEELSEMLSWQNIGLHQSPIGLLNVDGYWNPLLSWFKQAQQKGFIEMQKPLLISEDPSSLLEKLENNLVSDS